MQKTSIDLFTKVFYAILFSKPTSKVPKEIQVSSGAASRLKHPIFFGYYNSSCNDAKGRFASQSQ